MELFDSVYKFVKSGNDQHTAGWNDAVTTIHRYLSGTGERSKHEDVTLMGTLYKERIEREAEQRLDAAIRQRDKAFESLCRSIASEGYEVMHDIRDNTYSVRRKEI